MTHHKAGDVLQEDDRDVPLAAELHEVRGLQRRFGEEHAVVRDDPDALPVQSAEPGHNRVPVPFLEFVEPAPVHEACDHLTGREKTHKIHRHSENPRMTFLNAGVRIVDLGASVASIYQLPTACQ